MLAGKNIIVGVSGGIAAYKTVEVVSILKKKGANVNVIMTNNAQQFVSPLTFRTISKNKVIVNMFDEPEVYDVKHVSLAESADLMLVCPATANIIAKFANGLADDMLSTVFLATKAPVLIVPAMNTNMLTNPITINNIESLQNMGYNIMDSATGMLACGVEGKGRLPEPYDIVSEVTKLLGNKINVYNAVDSNNQLDYEGKKVLITAGPTREAIDPVRYITNRSSGKMGYSIAQAAQKRGAKVTIISGPVNIVPPNNCEVINVNTATEMFNEVKKIYRQFDIVIMSAAVADYRPIDIAKDKIKKDQDEVVIKLIKNPDIAYELGKDKGNRIHVGFCAETQNLVENAKLKMKKKKFDIIVANDVSMEGAGFEVDTNIISIISDKIEENLPKMTKKDAANKILDAVGVFF